MERLHWSSWSKILIVGIGLVGCSPFERAPNKSGSRPETLHIEAEKQGASILACSTDHTAHFPLTISESQASRQQAQAPGSVQHALKSAQKSDALACSAIGDQKIAVVLVNMPGSRPLEMSPNFYQQMFFGENDFTIEKYYRENSYGKLNLSGDIYTLNLDQDFSCQDLYGSFAKLAQKVILTNNLPRNKYMRFAYVMNLPSGVNSCWSVLGSAAGVSTLGCYEDKDTGITASHMAVIEEKHANVDYWTQARNFDWKMLYHTFQHEFGHSLGVSHASELLYGFHDRFPTVKLDSFDFIDTALKRWWLEYSFGYAMMGGATFGHLSAPHKNVLGWFAPEDVIRPTSNQVVRLKPIQDSSTGPKAIQISRSFANDNGNYLWIENRPPVGFDRKSSEVFGRGPEGRGVRVMYVDSRRPFNTSIATFSSDSYELMPGQKWNDPYSKVTLEVLENPDANSNEVIVSVSFLEGSLGWMNFTVNDQSSAWVRAGDPLTFKWDYSSDFDEISARWAGSAVDDCGDGGYSQEDYQNVRIRRWDVDLKTRELRWDVPKCMASKDPWEIRSYTIVLEGLKNDKRVTRAVTFHVYGLN